MTITPVSVSFLFVVIATLMIVEARRAAANERTQRARGGVEPPDDVYQALQIIYPAVFVAMLAEAVLRGGSIERNTLAAGVVVFALAKALKWWAILSLGDAWTFRVIVVPHSRSVRSGPYRWMRHPNYVGVVLEIIGVALMTDAVVTGPLALIVFGALLVRRIAVENRARDAILRRG